MSKTNKVVVAQYSIKDLEQLSGIKAHTIRIWEQRYKFLIPQRTDTNIRYYNDEDLKLVLNVAFLKDKGFKISNILKLSKEELQELVLNLSGKEDPFQDQLHALTVCMIEMDERKFEKVLSNNLLLQGLEKTMINVIYPFLHKIGVLWQTGSINPCHEHFISNLVRQKLIVAIDGLPDGYKEKALLFLPEGELHELGLLFATYILKSRGYKTIYFGQTVPFSDLELAGKVHDPDLIFTIITSSPDNENALRFLNKLGDLFSDKLIIVSGNTVLDLRDKITTKVKVLSKPGELVSLVDNNFEYTSQ